jgi:hypothetical protein
MFKNILLLLLFIPFCVHAQFYYKDIVSLQQTTQLQQQYKTQKIRKVVLNSFDALDQPVTEFICFQELSPTFNIIKTYTQSSASLQSVLVSQFNGSFQLIKSSDSSNTSLAVTNYSYNEKGQLTVIDINTQSYSNKVSEKEKHLWLYNDQNQIDRMYRIRNGNDTTVIQFKLDKNGLPAEESWYNRNGQNTNRYYYYYDSSSRLTDIVTFNNRAKRLLPENVFEYNETGQLASMLSVQSNSSNYLIWRYRYNEKGLKEREICYNKQKQIVGYIMYRYQ